MHEEKSIEILKAGVFMLRLQLAYSLGTLKLLISKFSIFYAMQQNLLHRAQSIHVHATILLAAL